jgi:nucleoside-diphosphate-sugar epimerase
VLVAAMARPDPGAIYNVCDDEPCPPQEVLKLAAEMIGLPPPPEVAFEDAEMSPMARSFYCDSKRVRNDRIKRDLGVRLAWPTLEGGLRAILAAETIEEQAGDPI